MFIVAIVLFVLFLVALAARLGTRHAVKAGSTDPDVASTATAAAWVTGVLGILCGLALFISCWAIVGTKEVGIVTTFNRPVGELDNGFHLIAPWSGVTEMDAAIQTDQHDQEQHDCINARIAHQIVACVDVTVRWRIQPSSADELFQDYRDFSNVRNSLVTRELATDLNSTFATYDPLAVDEQGNTTAAPLNSLASDVQSTMRSQIGVQVDVLSVFVPVMHFDGATQGRINALQAQIAQTRIAQQAIRTAQAQAAANQALAASVITDPNVLVSKCLDTMQEMVNKKVALPAGFSCWPGGSTGVVIPATK